MNPYEKDGIYGISPELADARDRWWGEWDEANSQPPGLGYDIEQGWDAAWACIEQYIPEIIRKAQGYSYDLGWGFGYAFAKGTSEGSPNNPYGPNGTT